MSNGYENVEVKIFPSPEEYRGLDRQEEEQVAKLVRQEVLPREKAEYHSVSVKVVRKEDGAPDYLVTYLLRKDSYTADVVRVNVDEDYEVRSFEDEYTEPEEDEEEEEGEDTYEAYDFIAATPVPEIPTAKAAVEKVHQMAQNAGLKSRMLLGPDATVANYRHYLASGLRGFVNVGHGNTNVIVLHDGPLYASWFQGLTAKQVAPGVIYFNSCKVFNNPLQPAVMSSGARTYVGGIVNLGIGTSEEVCKCFWQKALQTGSGMGYALKFCEQAHYPTQGAHGIAGDLGAFNFISSVIDSYKVVLYGERGSGDLVAYIHCYRGRTNVMSCEFYRDGSTMPQNRYKGGRVGLVYPWSRFGAVMDVLRNERPLYFGFILSTRVGYIATHQEPVGEGAETP